MCEPAPAARRALAEATLLWPNRRRTSDGVCPSQAHSLTNPTSDHERGMAFDLSHDPWEGCDAHHLAEQLMLRNDWRCKYVISRRRIWNPSIAPGWREYGGANPHDSHMHVSLVDAARDDDGFWWVTPLAPAQDEPYEEDDVALFRSEHDERATYVTGLFLQHLGRYPADGEVWPWVNELERLQREDPNNAVRLVLKGIADGEEARARRP